MKERLLSRRGHTGRIEQIRHTVEKREAICSLVQVECL